MLEGDARAGQRAEAFLLGHGTPRAEWLLAITRQQWAVPTHASSQIATVVGVAEGAAALGDRLAWPGEPGRCCASRCHGLCHLLQARGPLWGAPRAALCRLGMSRVERGVQPLARLFGLGGGLCGRALFDGQGG